MVDIGMLEDPQRNRRRLLQLAREEEGTRIGGQRAREHLSRAGPRELDSAAAVQHRLTHTTVERQRARHQGPAFDIRIRGPGELLAGLIGEPEEPTLLDRAPAIQHNGDRGRDREPRMRNDAILRQRTNPAQKRPAGAASEQRQAIVDQEVRDELIITRGPRMSDRFDRHPSRSQPLGGSAMDPRRRRGLQRGELRPRILGKQRGGSGTSHLAPASRRTGSRARARRSGPPISAVEHAVAEVRRELGEDRHPVQERPRVLAERRENLAAQVLGHEPVIAPERPHGPRRILDSPQPQPRQHQRRRPALGALHQHVDLLRTELEPAENRSS